MPAMTQMDHALSLISLRTWSLPSRQFHAATLFPSASRLVYRKWYTNGHSVKYSR